MFFNLTGKRVFSRLGALFDSSTVLNIMNFQVNFGLMKQTGFVRQFALQHVPLSNSVQFSFWIAADGFMR